VGDRLRTNTTSERNQALRLTKPAACPVCRLEWVPGNSWGSKQAYHVIHQPVSVVSQCSLIAWLNGLASGDQRRLTGSGSALETCSSLRDDALYKWPLLLYLFTYTFYILDTKPTDSRMRGVDCVVPVMKILTVGRPNSTRDSHTARRQRSIVIAAVFESYKVL